MQIWAYNERNSLTSNIFYRRFLVTRIFDRQTVGQ